MVLACKIACGHCCKVQTQICKQRQNTKLKLDTPRSNAVGNRLRLGSSFVVCIDLYWRTCQLNCCPCYWSTYAAGDDLFSVQKRIDNSVDCVNARDYTGILPMLEVHVNGRSWTASTHYFSRRNAVLSLICTYLSSSRLASCTTFATLSTAYFGSSKKAQIDVHTNLECVCSSPLNFYDLYSVVARISWCSASYCVRMMTREGTG